MANQYTSRIRQYSDTSGYMKPYYNLIKLIVSGRYEAAWYEEGVYEGYPARKSFILGSCQIMCGILFIILGAIAMSSFYPGTHGSGYGIWMGLLFCLAGSLAIPAAIRPVKCRLVAFMVLSIVSASMTVIALILTIINLAGEKNKPGLNGLLLLVSVIEGAAGIWSSTLCCPFLCCCAKDTVQDNDMTEQLLSVPNFANVCNDQGPYTTLPVPPSCIVATGYVLVPNQSGGEQHQPMPPLYIPVQALSGYYPQNA